MVYKTNNSIIQEAKLTVFLQLNANVNDLQSVDRVFLHLLQFDIHFNLFL
jgi:hypothetical protein